jgi:hypothetical protein
MAALPAAAAFVPLTGNIFHRQNALIELAPVGNLLGASGFFNGPKLHKGIISLQIDANKFAKGFKQHLQIFSLRGFFVKVDDKQSIGWSNLFATVIFLAFDSSISSGKFGAKSVGKVGHRPVV